MEKIDPKKTELVILLQGNFVVVSIIPDERPEVDKLLVDVMKRSFIDPLSYIKLKDCIIFGNKIMGWYYREPFVAPADKIIRFMDKKLPNDEEGWKRCDDEPKEEREPGE